VASGHYIDNPSLVPFIVSWQLLGPSASSLSASSLLPLLLLVLLLPVLLLS
jgi:hypothetical protein